MRYFLGHKPSSRKTLNVCRDGFSSESAGGKVRCFSVVPQTTLKVLWHIAVEVDPVAALCLAHSSHYAKQLLIQLEGKSQKLPKRQFGIAGAGSTMVLLALIMKRGECTRSRRQ